MGSVLASVAQMARASSHNQRIVGWFPVRAHTYVVGLIPGLGVGACNPQARHARSQVWAWRGNQLTQPADASFSNWCFFLTSSLSKSNEKKMSSVRIQKKWVNKRVNRIKSCEGFYFGKSTYFLLGGKLYYSDLFCRLHLLILREVYVGLWICHFHILFYMFWNYVTMFLKIYNWQLVPLIDRKHPSLSLFIPLL